MISALIKRMPREETNTRTQGEGHVNMKAECGVMLLQTSTPPSAGRDSFSLPSEGTNPANTWSQAFGLQNCEAINVYWLNHSNCGTVVSVLGEKNIRIYFKKLKTSHT